VWELCWRQQQACPWPNCTIQPTVSGAAVLLRVVVAEGSTAGTDSILLLLVWASCCLHHTAVTVERATSQGKPQIAVSEVTSIDREGAKAEQLVMVM
jgi:hypothetical protein